MILNNSSNRHILTSNVPNLQDRIFFKSSLHRTVKMKITVQVILSMHMNNTVLHICREVCWERDMCERFFFFLGHISWPWEEKMVFSMLPLASPFLFKRILLLLPCWLCSWYGLWGYSLFCSSAFSQSTHLKCLYGNGIFYQCSLPATWSHWI